MGGAALVIGLGWSGLLFLSYGAAPLVPVWIPLAAGLVVAAAASWAAGHWANRPGWRGLHALALTTVALLASMAAGFLVLTGTGTGHVDFVGKAILNAIAVAGLIRLGMRFGRDAQPARSEV